MKINFIQDIIDLLRGKKHFKKINSSQLLKHIFSVNKNRNEFVEITKTPFKRKENDTKILAFYLPQFHTIKENDEIHGKGFTEWLNVTKALPQFEGHYQPHLPIDVGFYDLSHDDIMYRQIELAKMYGIYGFCFYYYWFSGGRRVLEKPILNYLNNKDLDLPFSLCWANENWSKLWDGGNKQVFIKQDFKEYDFKKYLTDIIDFFKDNRYIKIKNKPLFIIYRTDIIEDNLLKNFIKYINEEIKKFGFDGIYSLAVNFGEYDPDKKYKLKSLGFEDVLEFPPHGILGGGEERKEVNKYIKSYVTLNNNFLGKIVDMKEIIHKKLYATNAKFKGVFPSWDNSPRKCNSGCYIFNLNTEDFKIWLEDCIKETKKNNSPEEQFIFINAWNEWAEGAHLEPDYKYGYRNLNAVKEVLEKFQ